MGRRLGAAAVITGTAADLDDAVAADILNHFLI
jgi:hypothetical protein